jgi:protein-S-isoprenylcysteine O-methyltransferase Ste14
MSRTESFGRFLFKIRSYSPLPVLAAILFLLVRDRLEVPPGGISAEPWWLLGGLLSCLLGQALRVWVLGQVQNGTSGQNDYLEAVALNTAGPYAHVRNPLYVGNFLICLGLAAAAGNVWAGALGLGFFVFEYAFIVPAEEGFLRERFGAAYDAYCRSVPRWFWRLRAANDLPLSSHFDWQRALKKEHNPFAAWASGLLVLVGLKVYVREGIQAENTLWSLLAIEAALLLVYAGVKGWKRGWWLRATPNSR